MIKQIFTALVMTTLVGSANMAAASDCVWPYVEVIGGASVSQGTSLNLSTGYAAGGVAGVEFCNARVEAEVAYRTNKIDEVNSVKSGGDISVLSYLVNGYYEFDVNSKVWRPYAGVGAGLATAELSGLTIGGVPVSSGPRDTRFAYQGIAGVGFYVTKHIVFDASYRYFSTLRYQFDSLSTSYSTHNVLLGARLRF